VQARNVHSLSADSAEVTVLCAKIPDAPINLADLPDVTTDIQIGVTWVDGAADGGSPILDYRVSYDPGTGNWVVAANDITTNSYTVTSLIAGNTYKLKVESRNAVAYSLASTQVIILAAKQPDSPVSVANDPTLTDAT